MDFIYKDEICKPIPGFPRYHISESGKVYRTTPIKPIEKKIQELNNDIVVFHEVAAIISKLGKYQYKYCGLRRENEKLTSSTIANLVCIAFGKFPLEHVFYYKIRYKDGNFKNCHIDNIEYIRKSPEDNILTPDQIEDIKKLISKGHPLRDIAREYKVNEMHIQRIKTGEKEGNRTIYPPKLPFYVEDPKIRRILYKYTFTEAPGNNNRTFKITQESKNKIKKKIAGRLYGYDVIGFNSNISYARKTIYKLNKYFFGYAKAEREDKKLEKGMRLPTANLACSNR